MVMMLVYLEFGLPPTNIGLGWKGLPGTNPLAFSELNYNRKSFRTLSPKTFHFFFVIKNWPNKLECLSLPSRSSPV
jgi:hypothetical protein